MLIVWQHGREKEQNQPMPWNENIMYCEYILSYNMLIRDRGRGPDIVWSRNCRLATMTLLDKYSHYGYAHFSKERFKGGVLGFFILLNEYGLNSEVYMIIHLIRQNVNRRYLGTEYKMVFPYNIPLNPQVFFILLYIFMNSNVRKSVIIDSPLQK